MNPVPRLLSALALALLSSPALAQGDLDVKRALKEAAKGAKEAKGAPGIPMAAGGGKLATVDEDNYNEVVAEGALAFLAVYNETIEKKYAEKARPALKNLAAANKDIAFGELDASKQKKLMKVLKLRYSRDADKNLTGCLRPPPPEDTNPDTLPAFLLIYDRALSRVMDPPDSGERVEACCFNATSYMKPDASFQDRANRFLKACLKPAKKKK